MNILRDEVYGKKLALPILEQTRAPHGYMKTIINQRECLRTHAESVQVYTACLLKLSLDPPGRTPFPQDQITSLQQRLQ